MDNTDIMYILQDAGLKLDEIRDMLQAIPGSGEALQQLDQAAEEISKLEP